MATEHEDAGATAGERTDFHEAYCLYCDMSISPLFSFGEIPPDDYVPPADDADEWENIGQWHEPDCEWIVTRAHRIGR